MSSQRRTLQETQTALPPTEVIARAKAFFAQRPSIYAAYVEREGNDFVTLRGQGGEEIVLAAVAAEGGSRVSGATYMFDAQVSRFFSTLPTT